MAKAIFHEDAEIRSRKHNVAWSVKASKRPQTFPEECIALAVEAGKAERVAPRRKADEDTNTDG